MKRKFGSGQLKSVKSTLQPSTQSLIFIYSIMCNGQMHFQNVATFAVYFLKFVWSFWNFMRYKVNSNNSLPNM